MVRWKRASGGYVESTDGQYRIVPMFCGTTRAQFYEVYDTKAGGYKRIASADTQRQCKREVEAARCKEEGEK